MTWILRPCSHIDWFIRYPSLPGLIRDPSQFVLRSHIDWFIRNPSLSGFVFAITLYVKFRSGLKFPEFDTEVYLMIELKSLQNYPNKWCIRHMSVMMWWSCASQNVYNLKQRCDLSDSNLACPIFVPPSSIHLFRDLAYRNLNKRFDRLIRNKCLCIKYHDNLRNLYSKQINLYKEVKILQKVQYFLWSFYLSKECTSYGVSSSSSFIFNSVLWKCVWLTSRAIVILYTHHILGKSIIE